jgi:hypothetical protein
MRKFLVSVALVGALLMGAPVVYSASAGYELQYVIHAGAPCGHLRIQYAAGKGFMVHNASGMCLAGGIAQSQDWIVSIPPTEPGGVWVTIDGLTSFVVERDGWWM